MSWGSKRKFIYGGIVVIFFLGAVFLFSYPYINKASTCVDGTKNGDEVGVDCGGSCSRICSFEADQLSLLWTRSFKISNGRYNVVAYLENQNQDAAVYKIKYRFRFADKDNLYIGSREGETSIPPSRKFAIFEPSVGVGHSVPVYTTFEFLESPVWVKVEENKLSQLKVLVSDISLINEDTSPRLSATIKNSSLFTIPDLNAVAILYDADGNAISASRTYFEFLKAEENKTINFTWPEPFSKKVVLSEIVPMYNVFLAKFE